VASGIDGEDDMGLEDGSEVPEIAFLAKRIMDIPIAALRHLADE
jgi:hypothetical protein